MDSPKPWWDDVHRGGRDCLSSYLEILDALVICLTTGGNTAHWERLAQEEQFRGQRLRDYRRFASSRAKDAREAGLPIPEPWPGLQELEDKTRSKLTELRTEVERRRADLEIDMASRVVRPPTKRNAWARVQASSHIDISA